MMRKIQWIGAVLRLFVLPVLCQTAQPSQPDTEARVDSLLKQLSLEEKVDLIGGVDDFYIRDIPHIHFPRLKMSDGPMECATMGRPRPSGASEWRRRGIRIWRSEWGPPSARTRAPVASISCSDRE
jgi:hypothetical protein